MIDYKEAKKKISIISILRDWGYNHHQPQEIRGTGVLEARRRERRPYYVHQGEPEPVWCGRTQRDGHSDKGLGEVDEH